MTKLICHECSAELSASDESCPKCGVKTSHSKKYISARVREIDRAKQRLHGILSGISIDYELSDTEIGELQQWLGLHEHLHSVEPFRSVVSMLNRYLEDQVIDADEREELLEWSLQLIDDEPRPPILSSFIRRFHGILQGIAIDRKITDEEITGINDWLLDNEDLRTQWPFSDAFELVDRILDDGVVSDQERAEFMEFCRNFSEEPIDYPVIHDEEYLNEFMRTDSPICKPITYICDRESMIVFEGKSFCFTGPAKAGPRKLFRGIVEKLGGIFKNSITKDLNYLVIGAQSSPSWYYTTYGRKIETVMEERKDGRQTTILFEDDFLFQAEAFLKSL